MGGDSERQDLGKILVSALERISNLRDLPEPSTSQSPPSNSSIATGMARLFPSLRGTIQNNSIKLGELDDRVDSVALPRRQDIPCRSGISNRKRTNPALQTCSKNKAKRTTKSLSAMSVKPVNKDLVFIPDKSISSVPTHKDRLELESQGYIIHGFPFQRRWSEFELKCEIIRQFPQLEITGFEFLK